MYSYARIEIGEGSHNIISDGGGFLAYAYGIGKYESYGYNIGNTLLPLGTYILIDGSRVNEKSFCLSNVIPFEAVVNYDYTNIEWDMGDGKKYSNSSIVNHSYDSIGTYEISMIVTKKTALCSNAYGCKDCANLNDTVRAKVTILEEHIVSLSKEICYGDSYVWNVGSKQRILTSPGTYVEVLQNNFGCDSTINLDLIVHPIIRNHFDVVICKSETPYKFNDYKLQNLTSSGVYVDTLQSIYGCDSIVILNLKVNSIYLSEKDTIICKNEVLCWRGKEFFNLSVGDTILLDSLNTQHTHCDSVYKLNVQVKPTYEFVHVDTVCDNALPYLWREKHYTTTGVYYDSLMSQYGCDSVYVLDLLVSPTYHQYDTISLCDNEVYTWARNGVTYGPYVAQDGYYTESAMFATNIFGCDSLRELKIKVHPTYLFERDTIICKDAVLTWRGQTHSNLLVGDTTYWDRLTMKYTGCDSVYKLNVQVKPTYEFVDVDTVCDNMLPYHWRGHDYTSTGIYYDSLRSQYGCDSVYVLDLLVSPTHFKSVSFDVCDNDIFDWEGHNKQYGSLSSGVYVFYDSLTTKTFGCDSVWELVLTVHSTYLFERDTIICENEVLTWRGQTHSGFLVGKTVLWDSLLTVHKPYCDSVYKLNVQVKPTYEFVDVDTICDNALPYLWREKQYTTTGVYYDSLTSQYGCDSVFVLDLLVSPTYHQYDTISLCDNEVYTWTRNGVTYGPYVAQDGYYTESAMFATDIFGCDSLWDLKVKVHPTYLFKRDTIICEDDVLHWRERTYSGLPVGLNVVWDSLKTKYTGCDSVYKLNVHVKPTYEFVDVDTICDNALPYLWREKHYTATGVYYDSLMSQYGCDSVYVLDLLVSPTYHQYDTISLCDNEVYTWARNGVTYGPYVSQEDYYTESAMFATDIFGCDSLWELKIKVYPTYLFDTIANICSNKKIEYRGKIYYQEGVYDDSLKTQYGCDSIYRLILNVDPIYTMENTITLCDNESYVWNNGQVINEHKGDLTEELTTFYQHYYTNMGCDSILKLNVILCHTYLFEDTVVTCSNYPYNFRGRILTESGIYYDSLQTRCGCDSVYKLYLTVNPAYSFVTTDTICDDEFYEWRGNKYNVTGVYYDSLLTGLGCDSVYQLNLTVNPTYFFLIDDSICSNEVYNLNGRIIKEPGFYTDSLLTEAGCDSVYHLYLKVNPTTEEIYYDTLCKGDIYYFGEQKLKEGGYYVDTTLNEYGCQHINHLYLTLIDPTKFDATILDACADDDFLIIPFTYSGRKPLAYSVLFDDFGHKQGFEDVEYKTIVEEDSILTVPIPHHEDRRIYPRPEYYDATIFLHNGICSDSLITKKEKFLIKYPSWITEQHWNDVISLLNERYNGGYIFSHYQWYHNGEPIIGEDSSYIYQPLVMGDEYYAALTRVDDGKTFFTCPIYPSPVVDWNIPKPYAEVIPSLIDANNPNSIIVSLVSGTYTVYSSQGTKVNEGIFQEGRTPIAFPCVRGLYFIYFVSDENKEIIQKVMVY